MLVACVGVCWWRVLVCVNVSVVVLCIGVRWCVVVCVGVGVGVGVCIVVCWHVKIKKSNSQIFVNQPGLL